MAKVRLGFADLVLARPLTWALLKGEHAELFATSVLPHRRVAPLLSEGALDVGLVTEAERQQIGLPSVPDLGVVLVPGGGAALLVPERTPPSFDVASTLEAVDECPGCQQAAAAAVEASAAGSLRLKLGLVEHEHSLKSSDAKSDEVGARRSSGKPVDLAQLYCDTFGTEPVAYVWAHRPDFEPGSAEFALKSSLRFGLSGLAALSRELAAERSTSAAHVERLLRTGVRYVRPARKLAG